MTDMRDWLGKVSGLGQLKKPNGADWNLEIGAITQLNLPSRMPPVLLFDEIKGYPKGFRVVTSNSSNSVTLALVFGLPGAYSDSELCLTLGDKFLEWEKAFTDFPPKIVKTGPILENIDEGNRVNLFKFPTPKWNALDGGRYIGTGDAVITKDPENGEINLGAYRIMIHDETTLGIYLDPPRHGRHHIKKYHDRGKPAPVAVSVGHHPLIFRISGVEVPEASEYGIIGAVQNQPEEVIIEEVTGLPIPAYSEIVLAGWCPPGEKREEGPFVEWTGYYGSGVRPEPIIKVERVYHRNDPIILGAPNFKVKKDGSYFKRIERSALLRKDLIACGIPGVKEAWISEESSKSLIIVSIKQRYAGHARHAGLAASQSRQANPVGRYVIVVDDDIDASNLYDVMWAVSTRSDPANDIDIIRKAPSGPLDPLLRKPTNSYFNSRAIIDACKPFDWKDEFPQSGEVDAETMKAIKEKWSALLGM
ncbi:MAG: UbiD family decarboxylase [Chloroflexi bacterium]|nr:UbiD family decarboxylase [Chloroflexota bacterium]